MKNFMKKLLPYLSACISAVFMVITAKIWRGAKLW